MSIKLLELDVERRNALLNASLKEFALKGFDAASTNIIAKEAGISKPLMFHYVGSKYELFLSVYDYFYDVLVKEYYNRIDYDEKDLFHRLRKSYVIQLELINKYPQILEFNKLSMITNSHEINLELEKRELNKHSNCYPDLFDNIDESKFRKGLNIDQCKQFIYWSNIGFINQLLDDIRKEEIVAFRSESIIKKLDEHFDELRNIYYAVGKE